MSTAPLPFPHTPSAQVGPVVPLPAGVRIDRFIIEKTLHQGPHGFAYLVREAGHQQPLVLLECFPRALAIRQPDGAVRARQAGDAIALSVVCEAFVQDARALAAVDHPGVVKLFGIINANRTIYRVMPFIDGQTLEEQRIERAEPPTVGGLVRLYDKLLDALEALHRAGFVHGLVQPDQILMKRDDNAPVLLGMDGVAIELGEVTMSPWAAPEQQQSLRFERVNASADLYMLAATMCFAATGAAPPRAEERLAGDPWDPAQALAAVPLGGGDAPALRDQLVQAVTASLALAAAARPQRADDVRHILHPRSGSEPSGFVATTGSAPLWVGDVPDRDSQWETLEGMSAPAPLRGEAETQMVFEPADVARAEALAMPAAAQGVPGDPIVAPVRATRRADTGAAGGPGRRATDTARPGGLPRFGWLALGGAGALLMLALMWSNQREGAADVPVSQTTLPPAPAPAAVVAAPTPAPVVQPAPAPPPVSVAPAAAPPAPPPTAAAPAPAPETAATPAAAPPPPVAAAAPPPAAPPAAAPVVAAPPPAAKPPPPPPKTAAAKPAAKPPATKTAAPARPAKPAQRSAAAESLCANRTQFSYLYCMQEACARPAQRNNAQCAALRRSGDIR